MNRFLNTTISTNLSSIIQIRPNGLRSINVENDLENLSIAENYVLTAQSRSCISRILLQLPNRNYGRSWTLTGPYGSGKSFFSLFLLNLTCSTQKQYKKAGQQLSSVDPILSTQIIEDLDLINTKGLFPIAITGFRASFQECLKQGLLKAINRLQTSPELNSLIIELENWTYLTNSRVIVNWLNSFKTFISINQNYHGILLVFDEMGKPLEFTASHSEEADVFLLQELAEFANRSGDNPLIFIGILHQSFDRYASTLDQTTKKEWAKVQGRFEDISFQEPFAQQTRLLSRTITSKNNEILTSVPNLKLIAHTSIEAGWCPQLMKQDEFEEICQVSYPFHPSTLVILPYVFKRLAQNERSIFAFLASFEPYGFQEYLNSHTAPDFLRLPDIFDYIVANFQSKLYASNRSRALTESLEKLNSTTSLTDIEIEIIKTIGLLSWLSEVSTLQPTENLLLSALVTEKHPASEIRKTLDQLKKQSVIVFRRFNRTYVVWQGSDVDIEERMEQAQRQVSGAFSIADAIQRYLPPRPIVARRHSYQTGTLRFFEVRYFDISSLNVLDLQPSSGASGVVILCLAANQFEISEFANWAKKQEFSEPDGILIGITKQSARITELLYDLRCYHWVEENTPELRDDKTAQKELFTQINSVESLIQRELDESVNLRNLSDLSGSVWIHKGNKLRFSVNDGISQVLSMICDNRFNKCPIIKNELINRHLLSSQSAAARRNLTEAMLTKSGLTKLGISGFPPERSIYESLLAHGKLHEQSESGEWKFVEPDEENPLNLQYAWKEIYTFVFNPLPEARPVIELYKVLTNAPFGIPEGVLPILLCAFLQVYKDETTLYREGSLLAEPGIADWEVLLRRPDLFSVAGCRVTGTRAAIVTRIARGFNTSAKVMPVVRILIQQLKSLPEYAWKTNQLSSEAVALRRAIELAHSPEKLLFGDLPQALGLDYIDGNKLSDNVLNEFFERLNQVLSELATVTPRRRDWARDVFLKSCNLPQTPDSWQSFIEISREMNGRISNPNLSTLVKRAAEAPDSPSALESVLALLANRPMRAWTDLDVERFPMLSESMGRLFIAERNGYLPGLTLNTKEKKRSQDLADTLQAQIEKSHEDPRILQAALQKLIEIYRTN